MSPGLASQDSETPFESPRVNLAWSGPGQIEHEEILPILRDIAALTHEGEVSTDGKLAE